MQTFKNFIVLVAVLVVIAVLSVASWQLGWFVEAKNVDRRTQVDDRSQGRQQALVSKTIREIAVVRDIDTQEQTPEVVAQRAAIVEGICASAGQLTGSVTLPPQASAFISQECY